MAGDLVATPPKFNMEPKNEGLEDVFPFHMGDSQVPAVSFPGCTLSLWWGRKPRSCHYIVVMDPTDSQRACYEHKTTSHQKEPPKRPIGLRSSIS